MAPVDELLVVYTTDAEGSGIREFIDVIRSDEWDDWISEYKQLELTIRRLGLVADGRMFPSSKHIRTVKLSSIGKAQVGTIYWCRISDPTGELTIESGHCNHRDIGSILDTEGTVGLSVRGVEDAKEQALIMVSMAIESSYTFRGDTHA